MFGGEPWVRRGRNYSWLRALVRASCGLEREGWGQCDVRYAHTDAPRRHPAKDVLERSDPRPRGWTSPAFP